MVEDIHDPARSVTARSRERYAAGTREARLSAARRSQRARALRARATPRARLRAQSCSPAPSRPWPRGGGKVATNRASRGARAAVDSRETGGSQAARRKQPGRRTKNSRARAPPPRCSSTSCDEHDDVDGGETNVVGGRARGSSCSRRRGRRATVDGGGSKADVLHRHFPRAARAFAGGKIEIASIAFITHQNPDRTST